MLQSLKSHEAQRLTSPNPFALLTVKKPDGTVNAMAVSWWSYASNHPAMLTVCLSQKGYSGECILREGTFTLSVVGEALRTCAFRCGTCSGRGMDKAAELGLPLQAHKDFPADMVAGSRVAFACELRAAHEAGDHTLFVAEATSIVGDPTVKALYALEGYARLGTVGQ